VACIPFVKPWLLSSNLIADPFAVENLKAEVYWTGFEWLIGFLFVVATLYSLYKIKGGHFKFIYWIFATSLFTTCALIISIAPKAEAYTQHAAIDFYKHCAKNDINVETIGFKSYATLFYGTVDKSLKTDTTFSNYIERRRAEFESQGINVEISYGLIHTYWLLDGYGKKPACFVAKITDEEVVKRDCPQLEILFKKNGFIFYRRTGSRK
jgi:hypothetical protein